MKLVRTDTTKRTIVDGIDDAVRAFRGSPAVSEPERRGRSWNRLCFRQAADVKLLMLDQMSEWLK